MRSKIDSTTHAARAVAAISAVLTATTEVTSAPWWSDDWIEETVKRAPIRFDRAADRWRGLYRESLVELDSANDILKNIGASEPSKRQARGRISEARAALDLLKGQIDDVNQGDFYTYRYFASEGFLPGYSFPACRCRRSFPPNAEPRTGRATTCNGPDSSRSASSGQARSSTTRAPATRSTE
ncbi:hypothetical protein ACETU7_23170 [Rhodococcus sp. 3Y1]